MNIPFMKSYRGGYDICIWHRRKLLYLTPTYNPQCHTLSLLWVEGKVRKRRCWLLLKESGKFLHFELKFSWFIIRIVCWLTNYFVRLFTLHYWRQFVFIDCKVQSSKLQNTLSSKRAWMALRNIKHGLHKMWIRDQEKFYDKCG